MNKIFGGLMLLYGLFVLIVVAGGSRWLKRLKNLVGTLNGWGKCPGCGDTWWGKKAGMVLYKPLHGEPPKQASVSLCESCLANPGLLDEDRIAQYLEGEGWSASRVQAARVAVICFQFGDDNLRRL